jgi:hypothetical protein
MSDSETEITVEVSRPADEHAEPADGGARPAEAQGSHTHPATQPDGSLAGKFLPRAADQPGLRQDIEDGPVTDEERQRNSEAE